MKLKLLVRDSKAQEEQARTEAFGLTQTHDCIALIGPGSSGPTKEVSTLMSTVASIDRAIIGYTATTPDLSAARFSNFLRTVPSDDAQAKLMATLMKGLLVSWTCLCHALRCFFFDKNVTFCILFCTTPCNG